MTLETAPVPEEGAPLTEQPSPSSLQIITQIMAIVGGLGGIAMAVLFSLIWLLGIVTDPATLAVDSSTNLLSCLIFGIGLGSLLIWHATRAVLRRPTGDFRPFSPWLLIVIYIPALVIGQILLYFDLLPILTFPLFHVVVAFIPSLAIIIFVGRTVKAVSPSWREIVGHLASGSFLSTTLAVTLEIILFVLIFILVVIVMAFLPDGLIQLETFAENVQDPFWLADPNNAQSLLFFPPVLLSLGLVFVIFGPILEEVVKLLAVILLSYRGSAQSLSRARIFLWGIAAGAGFGLMENLFNTTLALDVWALVMLLRIGATSMHCLATGLAALGWYHFRTEGSFLKFVGAYLLATFIHIIWNALAVGLTGVGTVAGVAENEVSQILSGGLILLILALLILLFIAVVGGLVMLTRRVAEADGKQFKTLSE